MEEPSVTVTMRVPKTICEMLRSAAEKDRRSMANMLEVLILRHCEANGVSASPKPKARRTPT